MDDGDLVARAQAGDRAAFSALVGCHQAAVYRVCFRILGRREDAEDAAQGAFLRAYDKLRTFQGRSAFRTWLLRLAVNVALNARERRKETFPLAGMDPPSGENPEVDALRVEAAADLRHALQLLPSTHRAAVVLRDLEGLSYGEIAEILEVLEGTARVWAHRGRARLKELLT